MRIKTLIMAFGLGITAATLGMVGCDREKTTPGQTRGEQANDEDITSRVKSALSDDPSYKYPDVKVTTYKGTVQLSGFVNTKEQKSKAADAVKGLPGVKEVVNNITVKE